MLKKFVYFLFLSVLSTAIVLAGREKKAVASTDPEVISSANSVVFDTHSYSKAAALTYVAIDTMTNALGPANSNCQPIGYDPYAKVIVIQHRSKSTYAGATIGSGGIYYNYSTNGGTTWTRIGPMNGGIGSNTGARYPSMVLSNPTKAKTKDSVLVENAFPFLVGGAFGGLIYSVDPGVGANAPIAALDTSKLWTSQFMAGASTTGPEVLITAENQSDNNLTLFRAADGVTFTKSVPTEWANAKFKNLWGTYRIVHRTGTFYVGVRMVGAAQTGVDTLDYNFGVSKSTDKGLTWSAFDLIGWHALAAGYHLSNRGQGFTVDGDGGMHWLVSLRDTSVKPIKWSLFDFYKATGGSWTANKIKDLTPHNNWGYATLDQTGVEAHLSVSEDGNYVYAKWIDDTQASSFADSASIADVWAAVWNKAKKTWTTPVNLTATPTDADQITHVAPISGNDSTIHVMRTMQDGKLIADNNGASSTIYYAKYKFPVLTGVGSRPELVGPSDYTLSQNYPNPFNPTTNIDFTLPVSQRVSLKVYNMLGQEVATIMDGFKEKGSYFVEFNASKLASGVYLYKLQAGSFVSTKKMVLVK